MSTSSLGELLAEEGFKKPKRLSRRPASLPASYVRDSGQTRGASCSDDWRRSMSTDDITHRPSSSSYRSEDLRKSVMKRRQLSLGERLKEVSITSSGDIDDVDIGIGSSRAIEEQVFDDGCKHEAPTIKSVVSILNSYVERFFEDQNFRSLTYHRCASCFEARSEPSQSQSQSHCDDTGPVGVLKQAIRTVERVVEGSTSPLYLKKASLQLSVVASLASPELKGGRTNSGVPNSHLAACAHLYLAVAYKFRDKDRVSAKHLLHVFSDCPHGARRVLLPELWDRVFLARLSHLMEWYFKQEESIGGGGGGGRRGMAIVEEVYNKSLDVGTSRLAAYYKEWLVEGGGDAPELPSIPVPDESLSEYSGELSSTFGSEGSPRLSTSSSYKAMVSRELYESVLGVSKKTDDDEEEEEEEEEEENGNVEKYSLCSPDQLSFSDDDEWACRRTYCSHKLKDPMANESKHTSLQSLQPNFPLPSRARTRNLPPWPKVEMNM